MIVAKNAEKILKRIRAREQSGKILSFTFALYQINRLLGFHPLSAQDDARRLGRAIDQRVSEGYGRQISGTQDIKRPEYPSCSARASTTAIVSVASQ